MPAGCPPTPADAEGPFYRANAPIRENTGRGRTISGKVKIGSAGSFSKNPGVESDKVRELQKLVPDLQVYPVVQLLYPRRGEPRRVGDERGRLKAQAGWLLEEMGWNGKRIGTCGLWSNHALVVVDYGDAALEELRACVGALREAFFQRYRIRLENEVAVV